MSSFAALAVPSGVLTTAQEEPFHVAASVFVIAGFVALWDVPTAMQNVVLVQLTPVRRTLADEGLVGEMRVQEVPFQVSAMGVKIPPASACPTAMHAVVDTQLTPVSWFPAEEDVLAGRLMVQLLPPVTSARVWFTVPV